MPVTLITDTERLVWDHEVSKSGLYYRRPTSAFIRELKSKHTSEGNIAYGDYMEELIQWAVSGWYGIEDTDKVEIPFDKALVPHLPEHYLAEFVEALYLIDPVKAQLGN